MTQDKERKIKLLLLDLLEKQDALASTLIKYARAVGIPESEIPVKEEINIEKMRKQV